METLDITLTESMEEFLRGRVAEEGYGSVGDYVRDLIRADQERTAAERVEAALLEGLDSGGSHEIDEGYWEAKRRRLTTGPGAPASRA